MTLPYLHRPHDSGPIQWARGDVGLKPSAAARPVRRCSCTPATKAVLPNIHYARPVISRSGAALRRHHGTLCNRDMEPRGDFFLKNHPSKILPEEHIGEPLPWDSQHAVAKGWAESFFPTPCRNLPQVSRSPPPSTHSP